MLMIFVEKSCCIMACNFGKVVYSMCVPENCSCSLNLNLGDFAMTVYDLIQKYADKSEEEQKQACVGAVWDLEDVDAVLDTMDYDDDCLDDDEKAFCLAQAVDDGETTDEVLDCLRDNLQEALDNAGIRYMEDDEVYYDDDEHENGIEDEDDFLNRE